MKKTAVDRNEMITDQIHNSFFAGFDLGGWRQTDGSLISIYGQVLSEWPEEITIFGNTFTLEGIEKGASNGASVWENALYA